MKDEKYGEADAGKTRGVVPFEFFAKIGDGENGENCERNDFLNRLELRRGKFVRADAVCRDLKAVFEKSDAPTCEDDFPERFAAIFQMTVPGEGHEDVGNGEKKDCAHDRYLPRCDDLTAFHSKWFRERTNKIAFKVNLLKDFSVRQ